MSFLSFLVGRGESAFRKPYESLCNLIIFESAIFLVFFVVEKLKPITSFVIAGLLFASAMTWRSHGLGCNNGDEVPLWI